MTRKDTCGISVFIQNNLHPSLNPLVRTMLLDEDSMWACINHRLVDVTVFKGGNDHQKKNYKYLINLAFHELTKELAGCSETSQSMPI